jgi:hypothetical protein
MAVDILPSAVLGKKILFLHWSAQLLAPFAGRKQMSALRRLSLGAHKDMTERVLVMW